MVVPAVGLVVKDIAMDAGGLGAILRPVQRGAVPPMARHCCQVSSKVCYPGAKLRRWAPLLLTRFCEYSEDLIFDSNLL